MLLTLKAPSVVLALQGFAEQFFSMCQWHKSVLPINESGSWRPQPLRPGGIIEGSRGKESEKDGLRLLTFVRQPPIQGRDTDAEQEGRLFSVAVALADRALEMDFLLLPEEGLEREQRLA